jgi:signal transduction histidine kinase
VDIGMAVPADIPREARWPLTFSPEEGKYVRVSVKDQGDGIEEAQMEKIFDPFFSTRFIGRGLGLPLSLSIVKSHNGCIVLESIPGNGSVFHVFLPEAA